MPSPYYPIILFFSPLEPKTKKQKKKKNAWSQVNDLLKAAFRFRLGLRCLRSAYLISSENQIVGVGSRSGRITQWQCTFPRFVIGLVLTLLLPTPTIWFWQDHKRNVSDGVVSGVEKNGNVLILLTPIPSRLCLRLRFRSLIFTRS